MKFIKTSKIMSWMMTQIACATMVFSPLAHGQQAKNNAALAFKQSIQELGLNRNQTAKEFFDKTKANLPGYMYYDFKELVESNPNAAMPKFDVKSVKTSKGETIPVISFEVNGKNHTIQVYGEKDKYLQFNNVTLTKAQAEQPDVILEKLLEGDSKLQAQYSQNISKSDFITKARGTASADNRVVNPAAEYLKVMTAKKWKALTTKQRASLIVQMRLLYSDALRVNASMTTKGQKTSSYPVLEKLFNSLMDEAFALTPADAITGSQSATDANGNSYNSQNRQCISMGHRGVYAVSKDDFKKGRVICSVSAGLAVNYKDNKIVQDAYKSCSSGTVSCNPLIYGYDRSTNSAICVSKSDQKATWAVGGCEKASPLGERATEENLKKTEEYINSVLGFKGESELKSLLEGKIFDQRLVDEITNISKLFDEEIAAALKVCDDNSSSQTSIRIPSNKSKKIIKPTPSKKKKGGDVRSKASPATSFFEVLFGTEAIAQSSKQIDPNQQGACDQLRKRSLAMVELIDSLKCPEGTTEVRDESGKIAKCDKGPDLPVIGKCDLYKDILGQVEVQGEDCVCRDTGDKPTLINGGFTCNKTCPSDVASRVKLKNKTTLNNQCECVDKKGKVTGEPIEDQPGLLAKIFNTKRNKEFKAKSAVDFVHNTNPAGDASRNYVCKTGPNWWAIGGIALGVGGIVALLLAKGKTKTVTNTVTNEVIKEVPGPTETIDNTFTCKNPKQYPVITGISSTGQNQYTCVCVPCGKYFINGVETEITPNPITCECAKPPSEGGSGENPNDDGGGVPGAGGVGTGK